MKKIIGSILLLAPVYAWSGATYTSLCVEEYSVGYRWENKEWQQSKFTLDKYLFEKVDPSDRFCRTIMQSDNTIVGDPFKDNNGVLRYSTKACFNIRKMGTPRYEFNTEICREYWEKKPNGQKALQTVGCTYKNFEPDGDFTMGNISGDLRNEREYKDSMSLQIGKCSIIN